MYPLYFCEHYLVATLQTAGELSSTLLLFGLCCSGLGALVGLALKFPLRVAALQTAGELSSTLLLFGPCCSGLGTLVGLALAFTSPSIGRHPDVRWANARFLQRVSRTEGP